MTARALTTPSSPAPVNDTLVPSWRFDGPLSVIRVDGKVQLVVGSRLMRVGELLGQERIERISETEVWLRTGSQIRKLGFFEGIQRTGDREVCQLGSAELICQPLQP